MLAANLLPAFHAQEHLSSLETGKDLPILELAENFSEPAVNCDLCDFTFSSTEEPKIFSYDLHPPLNINIQKVSITETIHAFPQRILSLRAPPAVTA